MAGDKESPFGSDKTNLTVTQMLACADDFDYDVDVDVQVDVEVEVRCEVIVHISKGLQIHPNSCQVQSLVSY